MKTYKIACDWSVYGVMEIEAESLEKALKKAEEDDSIPLPKIDGVVDSSFMVNKEMSKFFYEEMEGKGK